MQNAKQFKCFLVTRNNPRITAEEQLALFRRAFRVEYAAVQLEKAPETGTLHLQGMFKAEISYRLSSVISRLPSCHITGVPAKLKDCIRAFTYCTKEQTRVEAGVVYG